MTIQYEPGVLYDWASSDMPAELPLGAEVVLLRRNLPTRITQVYNADWQNVGQFIVLKPAAAPARDPWVRVTDAEIAAACAFYRAGYDTLGAEEQEAVQQQGLSWLRAWDSAYMVEWFRERNKRA
ncbi:MAG: hypothetical protein EBR82_87885, partial [Caulobacteraceae bacterium]|nr:hypothetical protein [Caulobacteraceae bacterium]